MYEICSALTRILVPVMPHQAEDIWQNTPAAQKIGKPESIILSDWPKTNDKWNNPEINADFTEIMKLRETVTKAIEVLRGNKVIGSSLEVAVSVTGENKDLLNKYAKDLKSIFITSQAVVSEEKPSDVLSEHTEHGFTAYVSKAKGHKCERCWKYSELSTEEGYETICPDCLEAIKG